MERATVFAGFGGQGLLFAGGGARTRGAGPGDGGPLDPLLRPGDARRHRQLHGDRGGRARSVRPWWITWMRRSCSTRRRSQRFLPMVAPGGLVIVNDSLDRGRRGPGGCPRAARPGARRWRREAGGERLTSVVALGALIGSVGIIGVETARAALCAMVERKHPELLARQPEGVRGRAGRRSDGRRRRH